ncbi:MAG: glycosyltransferase family 39 protein [Marinosulfonomonas sp.]|nr:glycosyltransferase family 39 protein [Marinosulfonomonas sp.]
MPERTSDWLLPAVLIAGLITTLRVVALYFSQGDIFVDEAQYWLWGQNLDLGYYSKPPLAAWVIRATTELAGSNSPFWIRFPAPVFHGLTAVILAAIAARMHSRQAAMWTVVTYLTLPLVSVGSSLISTDTILAPFFALGLLFYLRLVDSGHVVHALLAGLAIGLAFMAKYAGVYFLLGAALAAIFVPRFRISLPNTAAFFLAFVLIISPNIYWNITHDLTTVEHTLDNAQWVRGGSQALSLNFLGLAEFFFSQFLAAGPFVFATLLFLPFARRRPPPAGLLLFVLPIITLVCVQALLSRALANWAFTAYLAGSVVAVIWLVEAKARWLWLSLVVNGTVAVALPLLTTQAETLYLGRDQPVLARYLGRDEISREILDLAETYPGAAIVAKNRDILADLFLTGHGRDALILSVPPNGRAKNYYQQNYPLKPHSAPFALYVTTKRQVMCTTGSARQIATIKTDKTAYADQTLRVFRVSGACLRDLD